MTHRSRVLCLFLLPSFWIVSLTPAHSAQFMSLGDLPGGQVSGGAWGVSGNGAVVVGVSHSGSGNEAFRWNASTGIQGLGDLPGSPFASQAFGASSDGSTIVGIGDFGNPSCTWCEPNEAFVWNAASGLIGLGDLPGGLVSSAAADVSADGSIVVGWSGTDQTQSEAFIWTAAGGMQGLGDLPGGTFFSEARGISNDGSVVAGASFSSSGAEAFRWDAANGMQGLGDLPGGSSISAALAISADGSFIVGQGRTSSGNEAFRWDAVHGMQSLGDLPGGTVEATPTAVSAGGTTVVGWSNAARGPEAFIWDATNGMRELDQVLIGMGVDLTGWTLIQAQGISDDGLTIVGRGLDPSRNLASWYAVIPEPSTAFLFAAGLAGLALRRRMIHPER